MIAKRLQKKYKASLETLEKMVDEVNVETIETEVNNTVFIELLDAQQPEINGIKLLEHPYRSKEFQDVKDKGGRIAVIVVDDRPMSIITHTKSGNIGTSLEDFQSVLTEVKFARITGKVGDIIKGNFTSINGSVGRPKSMTPEDFWSQLTERELEVINSSSEEEVINFITYINDLEEVDINTKQVKAGVSLLYINNLIGKKTHKRISK